MKSKLACENDDVTAMEEEEEEEGLALEERLAASLRKVSLQRLLSEEITSVLP